jgi:protein TIF31
MKNTGVVNKNIASTDIEGAQSTLCELQSGTVEVEMKKEQFLKCYDSVQYSCFNPVPPSRKLAGDLFYLTVKTLDAGEKGITCCVNGFYINDSIEKSVFKPEPSQRKNLTSGKSNSAFSYTLIGCLNQVSAMFGKNLEKYINQILNTEQYFLTPPTNKMYHWANFEDKKTKMSNANELSEVVSPLYGLDPRQMRDWNEEYQVVKDFPQENLA